MAIKFIFKGVQGTDRRFNLARGRPDTWAIISGQAREAIVAGNDNCRVQFMAVAGQQAQLLGGMVRPAGSANVDKLPCQDKQMHGTTADTSGGAASFYLAVLLRLDSAFQRPLWADAEFFGTAAALKLGSHKGSSLGSRTLRPTLVAERSTKRKVPLRKLQS